MKNELDMIGYEDQVTYDVDRILYESYGKRNKEFIKRAAIEAEKRLDATMERAWEHLTQDKEATRRTLDKYFADKN